ncbi:MAG: hypothetical protein ACK4EY_15230 [Flavipsychrobacter sp.]
MLKLIATSPKYQGEVNILYDGNNRLVMLDMQGAVLSDNQCGYIKQRTPVIYEEATFLQNFSDANISFIEGSYEVSFEMFWKRYDHKINKKRCLPVWDALSQAEQVQAYVGAQVYQNYLSSLTWDRKKADPERFLRDKMWNNEWK